MHRIRSNHVLFNVFVKAVTLPERHLTYEAFLGPHFHEFSGRLQRGCEMIQPLSQWMLGSDLVFPFTQYLAAQDVQLLLCCPDVSTWQAQTLQASQWITTVPVTKDLSPHSSLRHSPLLNGSRAAVRVLASVPGTRFWLDCANTAERNR